MNAVGTEMEQNAPGIIVSLVTGTLTVLAVHLVLTYVAQGAVMFSTVQHMAGEHAGAGDAFRKAFRGIVFIVLTGILEGLLVGFFALFCLIPGIIAACAYYVAVPCAVVEKTGPIESLRRSAALTSGNRVAVFWVLVVAGLISAAIGFGAGALGALFDLAGESQALLFAKTLLEWVGSVFQTLIAAVVAAVGYTRLRGLRDGIDAVSLAEVFA
jgi:hypothetical protein